jgi:hypothetical protein
VVCVASCGPSLQWIYVATDGTTFRREDWRKAVVAAAVVVAFASDEAKARIGPGAVIPIRVSRDAPLTVLLDAPGVETLR